MVKQSAVFGDCIAVRHAGDVVGDTPRKPCFIHAVDAGTPLPCAVDAEGAPAEPDAAVLRVLTLGEERPGSGSWLAEAVVRLPDGKASTAGLLLVDATGRAVRMHVAAGRVASADGSLHVTGRAWRVEGPPTGIGLAWFDHEDAATLRVAFEDVPLR